MRCASCRASACSQSGRPRRADVALPARRRVRLHARARRRHPAQRVRRLRSTRALRHWRDRAHRSRPRAAERALWRRRDRRHRAHHHAARRTAAGRRARSRAAGIRHGAARSASPAAARRLVAGARRSTGLDDRRRHARCAPTGTRVANDDYERASPARRASDWSDRADGAFASTSRSASQRARISRSVRIGPARAATAASISSRAASNDFTSASPARRSVRSRAHAFQHALSVDVERRAESDFASPFGPIRHDHTTPTASRAAISSTSSAAALGLSAGWEFVAEQAENTFMTGDATRQEIPGQAHSLRLVRRIALAARRPRGRSSTAGLRVERIAAQRARGDPVEFGRAGVRRRTSSGR